MELEIIPTERLLLTKYTASSIAYLFKHYPEEEVMRRLGQLTHEEFLKEEAKSQGGYTTYDRTIVQFKLALKETNMVIGGCGFHNWYSVHKRAELGYALNSEQYKQHGYMSEAVNSILEYGFEVMCLNRVEAFINPDNVASIALAMKFGFKKEGVLSQHFVDEGQVCDSVVFALLKKDYAANHE